MMYALLSSLARYLSEIAPMTLRGALGESQIAQTENADSKKSFIYLYCPIALAVGPINYSLMS